MLRRPGDVTRLLRFRRGVEFLSKLRDFLARFRHGLSRTRRRSRQTQRDGKENCYSK